MGAGEIGHMNEIPYTSSIRGIEILAEDRDRPSYAESRTDCKRNDVRLRVVYFTDGSEWVRSSGVEITQSSKTKPV